MKEPPSPVARVHGGVCAVRIGIRNRMIGSLRMRLWIREGVVGTRGIRLAALHYCASRDLGLLLCDGARGGRLDAVQEHTRGMRAAAVWY